MGRSKRKALRREMISTDVLACRHCGKCYKTSTRTSKIAKGLNIAKLKRHKKICVARQQGLSLPYDLVTAIVDAYQDTTINQIPTNGHMREMGSYTYNTETQTEHKDYETR